MLAVPLIVHIGLLLTGLIFFIKHIYAYGFGPLPVIASVLGFLASIPAVYATIQSYAGQKVSAWGFFFTVNFGRYFLLFAVLAVLTMILTFFLKNKYLGVLPPSLFFAAGGIPIVWFARAEAWITYFGIIQRY